MRPSCCCCTASRSRCICGARRCPRWGRLDTGRWRRASAAIRPAPGPIRPILPTTISTGWLPTPSTWWPPAATPSGASISSATTGAAASPGAWPTAILIVSPPSPCCHARIPTHSTARFRCRTAIRRTARGITRRFWSLMPDRCCWRTAPGACASGWPNPAFRHPRSRSISPCSATNRRWRRRWRGTGRAARSARRSA